MECKRYLTLVSGFSLGERVESGPGSISGGFQIHTKDLEKC